MGSATGQNAFLQVRFEPGCFLLEGEISIDRYRPGCERTLVIRLLCNIGSLVPGPKDAVVDKTAFGIEAEFESGDIAFVAIVPA